MPYKDRDAEPGAPRKRRGKLTRAELRQAVAVWLGTGVQAEVARQLHVTESGIHRARQRPEWAELEDELRAEVEAEQRAKARTLALSAMAKAQERLDEGDVYVTKAGIPVSVPVKARDCGIIAGIALDRLRVMEGRPTKIVASLEGLQALKGQFEAIARANAQRTIEGEVPQVCVAPRLTAPTPGWAMGPAGVGAEGKKAG